MEIVGTSVIFLNWSLLIDHLIVWFEGHVFGSVEEMVTNVWLEVLKTWATALTMNLIDHGELERDKYVNRERDKDFLLGYIL